jgi:translation initiation factor IF-1
MATDDPDVYSEKHDGGVKTNGCYEMGKIKNNITMGNGDKVKYEPVPTAL